MWVQGPRPARMEKTEALVDIIKKFCPEMFLSSVVNLL
jgi:hypothetical protein